MECAVCKRKFGPADNPAVYDVHDVRPDGELGTGFRLAFCPPTDEGSACEAQFRELAKRRHLELIPVEKKDL